MLKLNKEYKSYHNFSGGLAAVKDVNDRLGFIDKTGKEVIKCQYNSAESFSEDLALVTLHGKLYFINKKGEKVVDLIDNRDPF